MTPDDITRLAGKWECEASGWQSLPKHMKASIGDAQARLACAAELRTLAQQGKAGGVTEGWQLVPKVATIEMVQAAREVGAAFGFGHCWSHALKAAPQPKDATP